MKNIKIVLTGFIGLFLFQSCSEDKMDEINTNKNNPLTVPTRLVITDVITATAFDVTGSDYSFYAGVYSELNAGVFGQLYDAQNRDGQPQLASTYNNNWNSSYRQLSTLKGIISKCSVGGAESGNYTTLGIAQILYAYNLAVLTDLFGDIPNSEALRPKEILQPKLDKQEDVYKEIFKTLNDGISNLEKTTTYPSLGVQDLIYAGNAAKWKKAANGLLARYTMRLSLKKADYPSVINYVDASFASANEELKLVSNFIPNPYSRFETDRSYLAVSKSFYDRVNANGPLDARADGYFTKKAGVVKTFNNSILNEVNAVKIYSISALISDKNPIYLLSYHELLFLKAEAQARLGQDLNALNTLKLAIKAAYLKEQVVRFTSAQADAYIATIPVLTGNDLLKRIMVEKQISFYENEGIEAYNDVRRLKAMNNADLLPLVNPKPLFFPKRFGYGTSDVSTNPKVKAAFGDGSYVYSEDVWWAGGTR
ncbi:SusD/RagB family nutrient-binding outer membrane lipoprotein [Flavobacterium sp. I-SCBP12n]|uniref:SusD/RagB family nutrient-binding outer membrane lipoprotein n=1 Tax=Flavobacterium pygoscelis TaxID=2893176 RepID=A0A9X2BLH5_9FLAO|nr:SusD/RagB family nutrient-binding outer membrane lipoprotein [Flavobacterium pygoscelis]MCK8141937.1 SusD/RagB family nutrient-binding outer membrane lipoprotein [Flavobacterium pygoscelis]